MRFILNILVICLLWLVFSCGVPRHIRKTYIGCYNIVSTGIDSLLDLSGCFSVDVPTTIFGEKYPAISYAVVNFYEDGIVVRTEATTSVPDNFSERMQRKFHQISSDTLRLNNQKYYREGRGMYRWGLYELKGDTIKAQFINRP